MNKNIIIGVLVLAVVVLGYVVMKGSTVTPQEAATITSQTSTTSIDKDLTSTLSAMTTAKSGGKIGVIPGTQQEKIKSAIQSVASVTAPTGSVNRPYTCAMTTSGGGIYIYSYNSLYDQGAEWHPTSGTVCYAD